MYHGEVNVAQEDLNSFLAIAEELRVKGLTQNNGSSNNQNQQSTASKPTPPLPKTLPLPKPSPRPSPQMDPVPPPKRPRPPAAVAEEDDDIQEVVVPVKAEPQPYQAETSHALAPHEEALVQYGEEGYEDYGQYEGEEGAYDTSMVGMDGNKGKRTFFSHQNYSHSSCRKSLVLLNMAMYKSMRVPDDEIISGWAHI